MHRNIPRVLLPLLAERGDRVQLRYKVRGVYQNISAVEVRSRVLSFARGLRSLGFGPGERLAIMAPNGPEWVYSDLGTMACRGLSVPVYFTEGMKNLLYILKNSTSSILYLHAPQLLPELLESLPDLPFLKWIVVPEGEIDHPQLLTLADLFARGDSIKVSEIEALMDEAEEEELASIVYTSGTTGEPKGAMLSHRNFLSNIYACRDLFPLDARDTCLSFLPLSHVFERMAGYYFMLERGVTIAYAENIDSVPANMTEVRPTVVLSVPRLYEKMHSRILERILSGPQLRKQLFFAALRQATGMVADQMAGRPSRILRRLLVSIAREKIFSKLRSAVGGRLRFFISGGAPLREEVSTFFHGVGIPVYEGYGLTETSPVITCNAPGGWRVGSVGRAIPGTEIRIAEDGEILASGPGVFRGYWEAPEKTAEVFIDGWFRTGDIGRIDGEGFLQITDRKKDLIVTAGGENVAPLEVENHLKTDKYIDNAFVFGDRKPFLVALLVPNFERLERYANDRSINFLSRCDLVMHPKILDLVRRRVDILQKDQPPIKRIKRFVLISRDFSNRDGEVTPTLKLKRAVVRKNFQHLIDGMYAYQDHGVHDSGYCILDPEQGNGRS